MDKKVLWKYNETGKARIARVHGHFLYLERDDRNDKWCKWINGAYRGCVDQLEIAKRQLEREAAGEGEAWGGK